MQHVKGIIPNKKVLKEKATQSLRGWILRFIVNVLLPFSGYAQVAWQ